MPAVAKDHAERPPYCSPKSLQSLKIPLDRDDPEAWIGKQTDQVPPAD